MSEESLTQPSFVECTEEPGVRSLPIPPATPSPSTPGDKTSTSPSDEYKQVIVMRNDLNMRKGKMCAQAAHATHLVLKYWHDDARVQAWESGPFAKVTVRVDSQEALKETVLAAMRAGVISEVVTDSGRTEFHGVPTVTCAAIGPDTIENVDAITSKLKLL